MNCDQTQPLLDSFADGELGWGTARRVRRHLAACAVCAAELAEIRQMNRRVLAWQDAPAPAGLQSRIAAALPPVAVPASRRRFPVRPTAVGLAGLAAAIIAFLWLVPGQPGRPTIALADVEQAMQQVQTVSWQSKVVYDKPDAKIGKVKVNFMWLRHSPPALADTDADVLPSPYSLKMLYDTRGVFFLSKVLDKYVCSFASVPKNSIRQTVEDQLLRFTQFPQSGPSPYFGGRRQTTTTDVHQSYVVVKGRNQIRFDQDIKTLWVLKSHTIHRVGHVITWVDPETHRVIRNEAHISEDTEWGRDFRPYIEVEDQFQYNQTPPKGTFDWSPPAGTKIVRIHAEPVKQ
jgi:hypothetical protein